MLAQLFAGINRLHLLLPIPYDSIRTEDVRDDLVSIKVWVSTSQGFDHTTTLFTEYGPSSSISIEGLEPLTTYYVRYAYISKIDTSVYTISPEMYATTLSQSATVYGYLTRDPIQVAADKSGTVLSWSNASGIFKVYTGTQDVTGNNVAYSIKPDSAVGGLQATINPVTGEYYVTGLSSTTGTVTFIAVYSGVTIEQVLNVTKSVAGQDASLISLIATATEFVYKDKFATVAEGTGSVISANLVNLVGVPVFTANAYTYSGTLLGPVAFTQENNAILITPQQFHYDNDVGYVDVTATIGSFSDRIRLNRINNGSEQITVELSNPAHLIPASSTGETVPANYVGSGTTISVKEGNTTLQVDAVGNVDQPGTWNIINISAVGITADTTPTITTGFISFDQHANMTADQAYIDYTISYITSTGKAGTVTVRQSFSKSKAGIPGTSAVSVEIQAPRLAFFTLKNQTQAQPESITLTAVTSNITNATYAWYIDGTLQAGATSSTFVVPKFNNVDSKSIMVQVSGKSPENATISAYDTISLYHLREGSDAITVDIENSTRTIACDSSGSPVSGQLPITITTVVVRGIEVLPSTSVTYAKTSETGLTSSIASNGTITITAISQQFATATYSFTVGSTTIYKSIYLTKAFDGASAPIVNLTTPNQVFVKQKNSETIVPSSTTVTATSINIPGPSYAWYINGTMQASETGSQIVINSFSGNAKVVKCIVAGTNSTSAFDELTIYSIQEGSDSYIAALVNENQTISANSSGTIYAGQLPLSSQLIVVRGASVLSTGVTYSKVSETGMTSTINSTTGVISVTDFSASVSGSATYRATIGTTVLEKTLTISKAKDGATGATGASSINATLSNDSHVLPASTTGAVSSYIGSGTQIRVYEGATELSYDGVGTSNGTWKAVVTTVTNITAGSFTDSGTYLTVGDHSGVADSTDTASILYTITGKNASGTSFTITKTQTFSKSKTGASGTSPLIYDIVTSAPVITKDAVNATTSGTHSSITIQGKKYDGSATSNYGWVTVTGNGDTEATIATDTSTTAYTLAPTTTAGKTSYTIKLYNQATVSGATLLDTQVVSVVFKGATGATGPSATQVGFTRPVEVVTTDQYGSIGSITWPTGNFVYIIEGTTTKAVGTSSITATIVTTGGYANPQHGITLSIDASGNISYSASSWTPVNNSTEFKIGLTYNSVTYYGYLRLNRAKASDRGSLSITKTISAVTGASSSIFKYPGRAGGKAAWTSGTSAAAPVYSETYAGYVDTEATKAICDALGYTASTTYLKIGDSTNLVSPGTITTPSSTTAIVTADTACLGLAEVNNILVALTNNSTTSTISYSSNSDYTAWTRAKYGVPGNETDAVFIGSGFKNLKKLGGYIVAYNSYANGNAGKIVISTTGTNWSEAVAPAANISQVTSACYGAGKIALVYQISSTTYVGFTKDFSSWTLSSGFSNMYGYSIAYSPKHNRYVMGTANGVILYSDINSESTWTSLTSTDTKIGNSLVSKIAYGNGIFVAVPENQKIVVSYTGGTSWELGNTGNVVPSGTIKALEFINNQFVLSLYSTSTIEQKIYTSPDGMVWTNVINTSNGTANAIVYSENQPDKVLFGTSAPTGQSYSALTVATMTPKLSIQGYWDGTKWAAPGTYIDGNLLVKGSVAADAIAANTITGDKIFANSITADKISSSSNVGGDGSFNLDVSSDQVNSKFAVGQFTTGNANKFALSGLALNPNGVAGGLVGGTNSSNSLSFGIGAFSAKDTTYSTFNSALTLGTSTSAAYMKLHRDAGVQTAIPKVEVSLCTPTEAVKASYFGASGDQTRLLAILNHVSSTVAGAFRCNDAAGAAITALEAAGTTYAAYGYGKIYSTGGFSPFTGIHDGLIDSTICQAEPGDIIRDVEILHKIDISNSIVKMHISTAPNQKGVVGVCNTVFDEPPSDWYQISEGIPYTVGMDEDVSLRPPVPAVPNPGAYAIPEGYKVIHVNALGEGLINVCGLGGNIEAGDLIVTSSIAGKGMRQSDDIVRSITVAKSRETVVFDYPEQIKQIACIYLCG